MLLIELAQAHRHLAAARTGRRNDHQWACGGHIIVFAKSLVGVDELHIVGVAFNGVVIVGANAQSLKFLAIGIGGTLSVVVRNHHATHQETALHKFFAQAEHVHIVGDAQVLAHFVFLDVDGANHDHDFSTVAQLLKHSELGVWLEAG